MIGSNFKVHSPATTIPSQNSDRWLGCIYFTDKLFKYTSNFTKNLTKYIGTVIRINFTSRWTTSRTNVTSKWSLTGIPTLRVNVLNKLVSERIDSNYDHESLIKYCEYLEMALGKSSAFRSKLSRFPITGRFVSLGPGGMSLNWYIS